MLTITPVPAFADNYIWLIRNVDRPEVAIVDPGEAEPVLQVLQREQLTPIAILITHRHGDHVGGIRQLLATYPDLAVYGPSHSPIPALTRTVKHGDRVDLEALEARFDVIEVPGHTADHIAYYDDGILFCGDTLFACGCGRVFDGTFVDLHASLQRLLQLPETTRVYCAHEYTLDNIGFAKWVEPDNPALLQREQEARQLRSRNLPTVPSTLALERQTNPCLRTREPAVIAAAEQHAGRRMKNSEDTFITLRRWKDSDYD